MNKIKVLLAAIPVAFAMSVPNLALGAKITINHCGCNDDGSDLICKQISVNENAVTKLHPQDPDKKRGHQKHDIDSWVTCIYTETNSFQRKWADCKDDALPGGALCYQVESCSDARVESGESCAKAE